MAGIKSSINTTDYDRTEQFRTSRNVHYRIVNTSTQHQQPNIHTYITLEH